MGRTEYYANQMECADNFEAQPLAI